MILRTFVQVSNMVHGLLVVITFIKLNVSGIFSIASNVVDFLKYILQNLFRDSVMKDISGKPMRVIDIFSISIKYFKDFLVNELNKMLADGIFETNDIHFVLTVPAMFGGGAVLFFREAAINVSCRKLCK